MPMSEAEQLAVTLSKALLQRIAGAAAAKFITGPVLSHLNLSDTSQQNFQRDVVAQLADIREQLREVHSSLAQVHAAVGALRTTIDTYAISVALKNYYERAATIQSRYRFFVDGVRALANPEANHLKAAADIYVRLAAPNDAFVSDAMDAIHAFVVPNRGVLGLFDHILTGMRNTMTAFAQEGSHFEIRNLSRFEVFFVPSEGGVFSTRKMLTGSFAAATEYLATFGVPLMKHVLATQIQGLVLLSRAWAGGPHDGRLEDYVDNILGQVAQMNAFFAGRAAPAIEELAVDLLREHGRRLRGDTLRQARWSQLPLHQTGPSRVMQRIRPLFDDDWVMWAEFPSISYRRITGSPFPPSEDQLAEWAKERPFPILMLHRPWEGGVRMAYLLSWHGTPINHPSLGGSFPGSGTIRLINQRWEVMPPVGHYFTILSPQDFLRRTDITDFLSGHIGEIAIGADDQLGVKVDEFKRVPPAALTALLDDLPAKREELRA